MATLSVTVDDRVLATLEREARLSGKSLDEVVQAYLGDIPTEARKTSSMNHAQWRRDVDEWLKQRPVRNIDIDDDRDTIYSGPDGRGA